MPSEKENGNVFKKQNETWKNLKIIMLGEKIRHKKVDTT